MDTKVLYFDDISERQFSLNGLSYKIKARKKVIDYKQLRKIRFFNRKQIVSQALYYTDGSFYKKNLKVDFVKGFFYEGEFHMQDCYSDIENGYIKAESAIYKKDFVEYKNLMMQKDGMKYRKFVHTIYVN